MWVLSSNRRRSPFCNVKGAVIGDETKFSLYLRIIDEKVMRSLSIFLPTLSDQTL